MPKAKAKEGKGREARRRRRSSSGKRGSSATKIGKLSAQAESYPWTPGRRGEEGLRPGGVWDLSFEGGGMTGAGEWVAATLERDRGRLADVYKEVRGDLEDALQWQRELLSMPLSAVEAVMKEVRSVWCTVSTLTPSERSRRRDGIQYACGWCYW